MTGNDDRITKTEMVVLARRPRSTGPVPEDFALETRPLPELAPGQLLVGNAFMSVDPSMRGRLEETEKHYTTNFVVGEPLDGSAIGRVLASTDPAIGVGTVVRHRSGWRLHAVVDSAGVAVIDERSAPLSQWLGILGQTGFTAYAGLIRAGEIREGDAVFVSGAAGAVGSVAGQMARLLGASLVIGSAGGPEKCRLLVDDLGFDAAFDYRSEDPGGALGRLAPDGIDLYFDNVGGDQLVAALNHLNVGGRVALCGQISTMLGQSRGNDIGNLIQAILKRLTLRGFIVRDHEDIRPEFEERVLAWLEAGDLVSKETIVDGLDHAVGALLGMLAGANTGKMLVRLDPDEAGSSR